MEKRGGVSLERENIKLESERRKREFELRVMSQGMIGRKERKKEEEEEKRNKPNHIKNRIG